MKILTWIIRFCILFIFLSSYPIQLGFADYSCPDPIYKLAIVNSYDYDHVCSAPQISGIISQLRKTKGISFDTQVYYMKARKVHTTTYQRNSISTKIIKDVNEFNPDYVITTDDLAFEYIGIPLSKTKNILFSGLNKPFVEYKISNKEKFCGVEEKITLDNFIKILDEVKFYPYKFWIIKDNSSTGYYMAKNYVSELKNKSNYKLQEIQINSVRELREFIQKIQSEPKGIIVLSYQSLIDKDFDKIRTKEETLKDVLKYNSKHLELGGNYLYSKGGVAISIAPNFYKMGQLVGELLIENISDGWKHSIKYPVNFLAINNQRLEELGFKSIYEKTINIVDMSYNAYKTY